MTDSQRVAEREVKNFDLESVYEKLASVLLSPSGQVSIQGSTEDLKIIEDALRELKRCALILGHIQR